MNIPISTFSFWKMFTYVAKKKEKKSIALEIEFIRCPLFLFSFLVILQYISCLFFLYLYDNNRRTTKTNYFCHQFVAKLIFGNQRSIYLAFANVNNFNL